MRSRSTHPKKRSPVNTSRLRSPFHRIVSFAALCLAACAKTGPEAAYYYPVEALETGSVYAYRSVNDSLGDAYYWYYRSYERDDSTLLTGQFYDTSFEPRQFVAERIVPSGALLRELRLFPDGDSADLQIKATILQPAVYSFAEADTGAVLVNAVSWEQRSRVAGGAPTRYTLTRNRRFSGSGTFEVDGEALPTRIYTVRELIEQDSAGVLSLESRGEEHYARGVGLVYRSQTYSDGSVRAYTLRARFPMDSLIALSGTTPR